jgi:hypothetical protein
MHRDEHADERNELIWRLQQPVDGLTYIAPNIAKIDFITGASASTQVTYLSTSPAMMSPAAQDYHRVLRQRVTYTNRTLLTTPLWHQFMALGAIHNFTASSATSLTNNGFSRLRGLRITVLRAISTLAILVLYFMTIHTVSNVGLFSPHMTTNLYVSVPVSEHHRL